MITVGLAYGGQGYWDYKQSYGECSYMKYNKEVKGFIKANTLAFNTEK